MRHLSLVSLLLLLNASAFAASPAAKAPVAAAKDDGWIKAPSNFLVSRMVRAANAPTRTYDVILDVPPAVSGKAAKPKITQGCGDSAIDSIAWDYVKTILRQKSDLNAQNQHKELRFQLHLTPVPLKVPASPVQTANMTVYKGFHLPTPAYPYSTRAARTQGKCLLRVTFTHGRATQVIVVESTGDMTLDTNTAVFALANWTSPAELPAGTTNIPVTYQLTRGQYERGSMRTLSTDDQISSF